MRPRISLTSVSCSGTSRAIMASVYACSALRYAMMSAGFFSELSLRSQ